MRCIPLAIDGGASIWMTRSIAPMSMPSSSDDVATSAGSFPDFSASSISMRCERAMDPWCACTSVSPASSLSAAAMRSASRRELTKMSVERCARISSSRRGWMAGQIDARDGADEAGPVGMSMEGSPSLAISSTGTSTRNASCFFSAVSMITTVRSCVGVAASAARPTAEAAVATPPRYRATSSRGFCVADSPMRCGGLSQRRARRSSEIARCAPRLFGTSACTSSTITVCRPRSVSRAFDVNIR